MPKPKINQEKFKERVTEAEKQKPFVLNREQWRYIRGLSKDELINWLRRFYCEVYNEAIAETYMAVFHHLHDDYKFSNEQMENLFYDSNNDIEAINEHYVTVEEIRSGLVEEGISFLNKFKCNG